MRSQSSSVSNIEQSLALLEEWISKNGWSGYDPYDIRGTPLILALLKMGYIGRGFCLLVLDRFPGFSRRLLKVRPQINAKAMGLFAEGYLTLYQKKGTPNYWHKAEECFDWLLANANQDYGGLGWGYPFSWQTRVFIPKGTPSSVVTSIVARAFLKKYAMNGNDNQTKQILLKIGGFLSKGLNFEDRGENGCFSYTPIDTFHVHNANLFTVSTLYKLYDIFGEESEIDMGRVEEALAFTLKAQNEDGSWYYWGKPDKVSSNQIDVYHTGFILRCLEDIYSITGEDALLHKMERGLYFHKECLFCVDGHPRCSPSQDYPVDIHSCAEGILSFKALERFDSSNIEMLMKVTDWTIENMQDKEGWFYHRLNKNGSKVKFPYIRWGQAWMFNALTKIS
ncbi:hypothetical protein ACFLTO_02465 [Chloroflexota bacterium]